MVFKNGASSSSLSMESNEDMINNNFSVLIVGDVPPLIQMINHVYFKKFGLNLQFVDSGKKVVDLFHLGTSCNLIIMNKKMPVTDAVEVIKELRAMRLNTMIVSVNSCVSAYEQQAFTEAGLDHCFENPLTTDNIRFLVQELNKKNNN